METLFGVWPWYIAGPLLGIFVPLLLLVGNRQFGISSTLDQICYSYLPRGKKSLQHFSEKENRWKLFFGIGIVVGAAFSVWFLTNPTHAFLPQDYYSLGGLLLLFVGGLFIGFGTRYANGCTSGHAIFGLSILSAGSLKATISFFVGGLIYTAFTLLF